VLGARRSNGSGDQQPPPLPLLARDEDLPSGDELGAEFERFLAQRDEDLRDGSADSEDS
jgi:hypothetical protein